VGKCVGGGRPRQEKRKSGFFVSKRVKGGTGKVLVYAGLGGGFVVVYRGGGNGGIGEKNGKLLERTKGEKAHGPERATQTEGPLGKGLVESLEPQETGVSKGSVGRKTGEPCSSQGIGGCGWKGVVNWVRKRRSDW